MTRVLTAEQYAVKQARNARHRGSTLVNAEQVEPAKASKFSNEPCEHDGITFQSGMEGRRYLELKLLQAAGQVANLRCQVPFSLQVNGEHIAIYKADFTYLEHGKRVVEDVKGAKTDVYIIKKALMRACYGIEIRETRA